MAGPVNTDFDETVLARMSEGESLRSICENLKSAGCPTASRFTQRVLEDTVFATRYARAREMQAEAWADIIREHSAKTRLGEIVTEKGDGSIETKTVDCVDRSRLDVDSLNWLLAKLHPKRDGDQTQTELSGPGGGPQVIRWEKAEEAVKKAAEQSGDPALPGG